MRPEIKEFSIPGYQLTRFLGAGAFAEVWQAKHKDQLVALKFLDCRAHSPSVIATEIRILRGLTELKHPNIISLLGVQAIGKYVVLIMEYADGSLADLQQVYRQETGGNIPPEHALDLLDEAAAALDFLGSARINSFSTNAGLQHCDIKPSNLLLVGNRLKVGDFGLCCRAGSTTHRSGAWRGTPPYAAPELFRGQPTLGTDQYALAVCFCEMVMGDRPFRKTPSTDSQVGCECPIDLTKLREREFPIISRALHPYASSRWPSCRLFLQELRKAVCSQRIGNRSRIYPFGAKGSLRKSGSTRAVKTVDNNRKTSSR